MDHQSTVVSAYSPPGYMPASALVRLKEFPDCFCYPLHSKVSLFSPAGCKHKPASGLPNCPRCRNSETCSAVNYETCECWLYLIIPSIVPGSSQNLKGSVAEAEDVEGTSLLMQYRSITHLCNWGFVCTFECCR